jgi:hypothetical protein
MKKVAILSLALTVCLCFASGAFHWLTSTDVYGAQFHRVDKDAIKKQVDDIVAAIDGGKTAMDFEKAANNKPYFVFIMEEGGKLLVHPKLAGKSLKKKQEPVYNECIKATAEGLWVNYVWKMVKKHTYVRRTKSGLIVGSGYSEKQLHQ